MFDSLGDLMRSGRLIFALTLLGFATYAIGVRLLAAPVGALAAQAATAVATIAIVEPPFKPPTSWSYSPATLTIKLGTTVHWDNNGAVVHTATSDDGKTFDSRAIGPKAGYSFTPHSAGRFAYHCTYHPWMKGTIIVEP